VRGGLPRTEPRLPKSLRQQQALDLHLLGWVEGDFLGGVSQAVLAKPICKRDG
jgi:hypothetical protein